VYEREKGKEDHESPYPSLISAGKRGKSSRQRPIGLHAGKKRGKGKASSQLRPDGKKKTRHHITEVNSHKKNSFFSFQEEKKELGKKRLTS